MLRTKDIEIIKHLENYGFITINQCATLFYGNIQDSYTGARKRLLRLSQYDMALLDDDKQKEKLLKSWTNTATNQKIYSLDGRKASQHSIYIMDFYTKFIEYGAEIQTFSKIKEYMKDSDESSVKPDAYVRYIPKGYDKSKLMFLEVNCSHESDLTRYIRLYESGEIQKMFGGKSVFPKILVACKEPEKGKIPKEVLEFGKLDIKFTNFNYDNFIELVLT